MDMELGILRPDQVAKAAKIVDRMNAANHADLLERGFQPAVECGAFSPQSSRSCELSIAILRCRGFLRYCCGEAPLAAIGEGGKCLSPLSNLRGLEKYALGS